MAVRVERLPGAFGMGTSTPLIETRADHVEWKGKRYPLERISENQARWTDPPFQSREQRTYMVDGEEMFAEAGLLDASDWSAKWIEGPRVGGPFTGAPVPRFVTRFRAEGKLTIYVACLGAAWIYLDDIGINAGYLAGWTEYRKRIRHAAIPVPGTVPSGEYEIAIELGDGWAVGHVGLWPRQQWRDRPAVICQVECEGEVVAATGSHWEVQEGPILRADLLMGAEVDLRKPWALIGKAIETKPPEAPVVPHPVGDLTTKLIPGCSVKEIPHWPSHIWQVDVGQNLTGRLGLLMEGKPGTTVRIRHGEMLDERGRLYTENLRTARQEDVVTLDGKRTYWRAPFTLHGFRYAEIDLPQGGELETLEVEAYEQPSWIEIYELPSFDHEELDRFAQNVQWSLRGNFVSVPTDCPQRDERLGWTGDAQLFCRTSLKIADCAWFWAQWLETLCDSQGEDGRIPSFAPHIGPGNTDGGPGWADAIALIPWTMWREVGDAAIVQECWPAIVRWLDWLLAEHPDAHGGFGDWLAKEETPLEAIRLAYRAHSGDAIAEMAEFMEDSAARAKAEGMASAAREQWPSCCADRVTQTMAALEVVFNLSPGSDPRPELRGPVRTGFLGTAHILDAVGQAFGTEEAWRLVLDGGPGTWLHQVRLGATTVWERWDGWSPEGGFADPGMNSFNHYAFGSALAWMLDHREELP